jgi:hypothetical protein
MASYQKVSRESHNPLKYIIPLNVASQLGDPRKQHSAHYAESPWQVFLASRLESFRRKNANSSDTFSSSCSQTSRSIFDESDTDATNSCYHDSDDSESDDEGIASDEEGSDKSPTHPEMEEQHADHVERRGLFAPVSHFLHGHKPENPASMV